MIFSKGYASDGTDRKINDKRISQLEEISRVVALIAGSFSSKIPVSIRKSAVLQIEQQNTCLIESG
jgi:hypothetical protein